MREWGIPGGPRREFREVATATHLLILHVQVLHLLLAGQLGARLGDDALHFLADVGSQRSRLDVGLGDAQRH